jgi:hypothetical protein
MKDNDLFLKEFKVSQEVTMEVASWLAGAGYNCRVLPSVLRPDPKVRFDYTDSGDIEIIQRCEVKLRSINFDSAESWPFPDIFLDEAYKMAKFHRATLYGYAIVNKARTGMLLIPRSTMGGWFTTTIYDKTVGRECTNICAPKSSAAYYSLNKSEPAPPEPEGNPIADDPWEGMLPD